MSKPALLSTALAAVGNPPTTPTVRRTPHAVAIQDRRKKRGPVAAPQDVHLVAIFDEPTLNHLAKDKFPVADSGTLSRMTRDGHVGFLHDGKSITVNHAKAMFLVNGVETPEIVSISVMSGFGKLGWRWIVALDRQTHKPYLRVA
jgi:hypothetical protein